MKSIENIKSVDGQETKSFSMLATKMLQEGGAFWENPKVLIVDDKENERVVLTKLLSAYDIDLHLASSGKEALSKMLRHDYALILLDVHMPIMDGIETAKLIRSNSATERVPIIFLTAYDKDDLELEEGYKVGAIDYIIKPINEDILRAKVTTFIRSYAFEREKGFEQVLEELRKKNERLQQAEQDALNMARDANAAKAAAQDSRRQIARQTEELLKYTKELEEFAHVATHDLRVPIFKLESIVNLFRSRGLVNNDNREVVERLSETVAQVNTTLQDLSDVVASRKALNDDIQHIDIEKLFNAIVMDFSSEISEAKAEISTNFTGATHINYVPSHLRSILKNLLSNALKYRSPQRQPFISVTGELVNDTYCLNIKDNGIGIEHQEREKVFGLFQRINPEIPGKGIGLHITRAQIESMGGCIEFNSEYGRGTEFKVFLKNSPEPHAFLL